VVVHFVLLTLKTRGLVERWKVDIETLPQLYQTLLIKIPIWRGSQSIERKDLSQLELLQFTTKMSD